MGDALEIWVAWRGTVAVASIMTLRYRNTVVYKYGCSDEAYHKLGAIPFLLWNAMRRAKEDGVTLFDMGRSDFLDEGLIYFKDRWASTRTVMNYWRYPGNNSKISLTDSRSARLARRMLGHLPAFALRALGEVVYRHSA